VPLPGAPTCNLMTSTEALDMVSTNAMGDGSSPIVVPNSAALEGVNIYHQWAIWDPSVNSLGIVLSNGAIATLGN